MLTKYRRLFRRAFPLVLWLLIGLYPLIHSFFGIDLGDTGLHMFAYENLFSSPELIGFTAYFTNLIGFLWLKAFPFLGLWGLNLLEVILEVLLSVMLYRLLEPYLGKAATLLGLLLAVMASDTYLNIFNYHQWNVFLLSALMVLQFRAITKNKCLYSFFAGMIFALLIASRMGSVSAVVTYAFYFLWFFLGKWSLKKTFQHIGASIAGFFLLAGLLVLGLLLSGHLSFFISNIFRLKGLATAQSGGYSFRNLLESFVLGNLKAVSTGALFLGAFLILFMGMTLLMRPAAEKKTRFIFVFLALIVIAISCYLFYYSYRITPSPSWPQMSTGPAFTAGVMYVAAFLCLMFHLMAKKGRPDMVLLTVMSFFLPLLTIAGSNTGTKHVILGLWIIAPLSVYVIKKAFFDADVRRAAGAFLSSIGLTLRPFAWRLSLIILCAFFLGKYGHMLYVTFNFDSIHRLELTESIDSDKVRFLKTTQREADSVNGVLETVRSMDSYQKRPLLVYGGSLLFYSLLEMPSYVQPWFSNTNYANEALQQDLERASSSFPALPVVIYCKTNNYYGFGEDVYETLLAAQKRSAYDGKRDALLEFLDGRTYTVAYENDYYAVMVPPSLHRNYDYDYRRFILGK